MTDTLAYSGAEIPTDGDANNPPAHFLAFGTDIDHLLVLKADSTADRNSRYAGVPQGTVVSCAAENTVWMKLTTPPTAASWMVLAQDTEVTSGVVTAGADFTVASQYAALRNGWVHVRLSLTRTSAVEVVGDDEAGTYPSNFTDVILGTIGAAYRPGEHVTVVWRGPVVGGFGWISASSGNITLTSSVPSGRLRTGDAVEVSATYPAL